MVLTAFSIQNAKPQHKPYKLPDGDGLSLMIQPTGSKLWRFRYRFAGKENMLTFGAYPEVSLADARQKRDDARKLLAAGGDPAEQRKLDRAAAETARSNTFGMIADEYFDRLVRQGSAESTLKKNRWLLEHLAEPLRSRPITAITPAEILALLQRVERAGHRHTAHRLRGLIGSVFRLAVATLRAENDPTFALRGALTKETPTHRPAITDEQDFGALLRNIDEYDGWPPLRCSMQFLALTMTRPGDVRLMKRSEVDFTKATWNIPAERMKMRRPHQVPLSLQAIRVLQEAWPYSEGSELVFPSVRSLKRPLSDNAYNSALRRMGYMRAEVSAHGFRASASTILNERGYDRDVIEAALAHEENDAVRRAYNRSKYLEHRKAMMQEWADILDELKQPKKASRAS